MSSRYPVYKSLHTEICSMDRHKTSRLPGNQSREAKHVTCTVIGVVFPYTEPSNGNCEVRAAALSRTPSAGVCYNTQATLTIYLSLRLTARINVNLPVPVCDGVTARSSNNEQCLAQVSEWANKLIPGMLKHSQWVMDMMRVAYSFTEVLDTQHHRRCGLYQHRRKETHTQCSRLLYLHTQTEAAQQKLTDTTRNIRYAQSTLRSRHFVNTWYNSPSLLRLKCTMTTWVRRTVKR